VTLVLLGLAPVIGSGSATIGPTTRPLPQKDTFEPHEHGIANPLLLPRLLSIVAKTAWLQQLAMETVFLGEEPSLLLFSSASVTYFQATTSGPSAHRFSITTSCTYRVTVSQPCLDKNQSPFSRHIRAHKIRFSCQIAFIWRRVKIDLTLRGFPINNGLSGILVVVRIAYSLTQGVKAQAIKHTTRA